MHMEKHIWHKPHVPEFTACILSWNTNATKFYTDGFNTVICLSADTCFVQQQVHHMVRSALSLYTATHVVCVFQACIQMPYHAAPQSSTLFFSDRRDLHSDSI